MLVVPPVVVGAIEVGEDLLGRLGRKVRQPSQLSAGLGELAALLGGAQRNATLDIEELPLRQRHVPYRPAGVPPPGQPLGLPGVGYSR
jgi:hypothetical protein